MRRGADIWILAGLLLLFAAVTAYFGAIGFEREQSAQPSTYSTGPSGLKALYRLLESEGVSVRRFTEPPSQLPEDAGLLVIAEPLKRPFTPSEKASLRRWISNGGTLLLLAEESEGMRALRGVPLEAVSVEAKPSRPGQIAPGAKERSSPYLRDVRRLQVEGEGRIVVWNVLDSQTLVADREGAFLVRWSDGEGGVIVAAAGLGLNNQGISRADNAVLLVNIAAEHSGGGKRVYFDEYHQGFGREVGMERSVWMALGTPARSLIWFGLILFLLYLYHANRRFGTARPLLPPASRPSTEYITSMAGLLRRAEAADIALEQVYRAFVRDLMRWTDAPPEAGYARVAELAGSRFRWQAEPLRQLMARCEEVVGGERVNEREMLQLVQQIQEYRRRVELVRV
jgi:hypothetical protein